MNYDLDTTKLDELIRDIPNRAAAFLESAAGQVADEVSSSFGMSPSKPGDPPGIISGDLKASVEPAQGNSGYDVIVGEVYGLYLEFGTETIEPRPFMMPIFHNWERKFASEAAEYGIVS